MIAYRKILKKDFPSLNFLKFIIPIISLGSLYLGWNMLIDGRPFPATFYAKASPRLSTDLGERFLTGIYMVSKQTNWIGSLVWLGLIFLSWLKHRDQKKPSFFILWALPISSEA